MESELLKFCAGQEIHVIEAMQKIDHNARGILFILDEEEKVIGSLSDGDIRRWLIRTGELHAAVEQVMNHSPKVINPKEIALAVIPCLACSEQGVRLGYGGGYYDRYLPQTDACKIVLCRERMLCDHIPSEPHDCPVDFIITEKRIFTKNPEIHLHPSGQAELVKFLAFLTQYGVQVIVETHSDHIYNGIRKSIHLDEIDCENVSIYFFTHNEKGCSIPVSIPVNSEGKALAYSEGLFDQINKDLDVILGW